MCNNCWLFQRIGGGGGGKMGKVQMMYFVGLVFGGWLCATVDSQLYITTAVDVDILVIPHVPTKQALDGD